MNVSVVGLGSMGSALARALLAGGHDVTVWNRSAERCQALAELGASRASSFAEAAASAELIVTCVLDYAATNEIFASEGAGKAVEGSVIVNYSSGGPEEARACGAWAEGHKAGYIEGAILAYPRAIGTPGGTLAHSGPIDVYESIEPVIETLGRVRYMGAEIGLVNTLHFAAGLLYEVALGVFVEAAAYATAEGATPADVKSLLNEALMVVTDSIEYTTPQLMREDYAGNEASIDVHAEAIEAVAQRMATVGTASKFATALLEYLKEAQAAGNGSLEFGALYEVAKAPRTQ